MDPARQIADAVLYEGHVLWPYRRSALKNQQRWTFGGIYPATYASANHDRSRVSFSCLCEGTEPTFELSVRFLQIVHRQSLERGCPVDDLELEGVRYLTWDEARERELILTVPVDGSLSREIATTAGEEHEPLAGEAALARSWEEHRGRVTVSVSALADDLHRISVAVENRSGFAGLERSEAMRRTFASAHAVLRVRDGELVSASDPPDRLSEAVASCSHDGLWPILVGVEPDRSTLLASPIILCDYPAIAPESPGDFFDGGEIDQLLILNIMGLSDAERQEMRASDPRTREILERTEAMTSDELMRLHGTLRKVGTARDG